MYFLDPLLIFGSNSMTSTTEITSLSTEPTSFRFSCVICWADFLWFALLPLGWSVLFGLIILIWRTSLPAAGCFEVCMNSFRFMTEVLLISCVSFKFSILVFASLRPDDDDAFFLISNSVDEARTPSAFRGMLMGWPRLCCVVFPLNYVLLARPSTLSSMDLAL